MQKDKKKESKNAQPAVAKYYRDKNFIYIQHTKSLSNYSISQRAHVVFPKHFYGLSVQYRQLVLNILHDDHICDGPHAQQGRVNI